MYGSCFYIYSVSLYLSVGTFNPFTFKIIIDIYVPIGILKSFWVCFCRSFLSIVFTGYVSPFSICCKAGLVVLNSLNFCLSVMFLISPSILNEIFAGYSYRFFFFPFSTLNISCHSFLAFRDFAE